jgi:tape measure domain-containing protein
MPKNISSLSIGLFGDVSHFAKSFGSTAVNSVKSFAGSLTSGASSLLKFSGIGAAVAAGFEAVKHIGEGFKLAADLEKTQIQFAALIGDSEKAKTAISDLTQFAKSTPFELPALIDTSRQLLAFGVSNDKLLPSLKAIGDVAAGVGQPLEEVTAIFGRVAEEGTVSERSLRQFAKAGIPVVDQLAKQMGVNKAQIKGMAEAGQIGFGQLQTAFAELTGPAGKFHDQMEKQAGSLGGLWTRLSGAVEEALGGIAQQLIESFNLKGGISALTGALATAGERIKSFIAFAAPVIRSIAIAAYTGFMAAYNFIAPIVASIEAVVVRTFGMIEAAVTPIIVGLWGTIKGVWDSIYGFIAPIVSNIYQTIVANWQAIAETVTALTFSVFNILSSVWGVISDLAAAVWQGIVAVWQWGATLITGHSVTAGEGVTGAFTAIGSAAKWLADTFTLAFNVASYAVKHWEEGVEIVAVEVAASFSDLADRAKYVFVDVIPYALAYLGRNWKEIFIDLFNFQTTVMENLSTNVVNIFKNLPGLIAGGTNWSDVWKPLTEGFKSEIKETFQLPQFASSELTKGLTDTADKLENAYGKGLGSFLADKEKDAKTTVTNAGEWIKKALGFGETPITPKIEAPEPVKVKAIPALTADNLALSIKPEIKRGDLVRFNSAESQLLRFEFAHNLAAKSKGSTKAAAAQAAAQAPPAPAAPAAPQPPAPAAPPYQAPGAAGSSSDKDSRDENVRKIVDYTYKIWQNSQPGNQILQTATF